MTRARATTIAGFVLFFLFAAFVVLSASDGDMRAVRAANMRDEAVQ